MKIKYKNTNISFFKEKRLIFQLKEEEDAAQRELAMAEAEEFIRKARLDQLRELEESGLDEPAKITSNTRERLRTGPLSELNALTGGPILRERLKDRLKKLKKEKPEDYKRLRETRIQQLIGPFHSAFDKFKAGVFLGPEHLKKRYDSILNHLAKKIRRIGKIKQFADSNNRKVDLSSPIAENTFDLGAGESVTIKWHEERLESVIAKLKRAGRWEEFRGLKKAQQYLEFKYRHSLLDGIVAEETANVTGARYDAQWILDYLDMDEKDFTLTGEKSIKELVTTILPQKNLENLHRDDPENVETRALLSHIISSYWDSEDGPRVKKLLEERAGIFPEVEDITFLLDAISSFNEDMREKSILYEMSKKKITDNNSLATKVQNEIKTLERETELLVLELNDVDNPPSKERKDQILDNLHQIEDKRERTIKQLSTYKENTRKFENELRDVNKGIIKSIITLGDLIDKNKDNEDLFGGKISDILNNDELNFINDDLIGTAENPPTFTKLSDEKKFIESFFKSLQDNSSAFVKLNRALNERKTQREERLKPGEKPEPLSPRTLLYFILEDQLKNAGVTVETGLHNQSILRTNLMIAACRTSDKAKLRNEATARELRRWGIAKWFDRIRAVRYFSPLFNLKDALNHTIETNPELTMFKNINLLSTRADIMKDIMEYESENEPVTPEKLLELEKRLEQFIHGIRIEGKTYRIIDRDIPRLEDLMHTLRLIAEERSAREFIENLHMREEMEGEFTDEKREEIIRELLEAKNASIRAMDESISSTLSDREQNYYRYFLKKELKQDFNNVIDRTEDWTYAMRQEELASENITKYLRKRGVISIRMPHLTKKTLKIAGLIASSPVWIIPWVGYKGWKRWYAPHLETPEAKEEIEKTKKRWKGFISEPTIKIGGAFTALATKVVNVYRDSVNWIGEKFRARRST